MCCRGVFISLLQFDEWHRPGTLGFLFTYSGVFSVGGKLLRSNGAIHMFRLLYSVSSLHVFVDFVVIFWFGCGITFIFLDGSILNHDQNNL